MENQLILKNSPLKVLILEDTLLDLELITGYLSAAGYQLEVTHTEVEAGFREALKNEKYDIILSDFMLPGFNAFGALEICQEICPEVPFICVSGSIGEETAIDLLKKGAVDYVLKDRPARLPYAVQHALEKVNEKAALHKIAQELHESENRFRQVAESAQEWIWEVDFNGLYTYASPVIELLLGYTPDEMVGKKYFYDFFTPGKTEELKKAAFEVFAKRENFSDFENILQHKNGQEVIASTSGSPVFDDNGNFKGYRGVDEDITERRQAEEKLRKAALLLQSSIESPKDMIILSIDNNYNYLYFNEFHKTTMSNAYGKDVKIGMNLLDCITNEEDKIKAKINYDKALNGESHITVQEYGDIEKLYYETRYNPIFNDKNEIIGATAFSSDITDRKKAEEKIQKQNVYIKMILDNFPIGIATNEIDSMKRTYMNRKFSEIYGWPEDDFPYVRNFFEKVFPDLEYRQELQTRILADISSGDSERMNWDNLKITTKAGDQRIVYAHNIPLLSHNIMVSTVQDITERKQAEQALLAKMDELERFHKLTVGREITMVELKKEVNNLLNKLGQDNKYKIVE